MGHKRFVVMALASAIACATWAADASQPAVAAAQAIEPAVMQVEARGWRLRQVTPNKVVRVWDLPVLFTSLEDVARVAETGQLERLAMAMNKPATLDFADTPIQDVCAFLQQFAGVPIVVDRAALPDPPPTITLKVDKMPFRQAFLFIVKLTGLDYRIIDGSLFVSEPEALRARQAMLACDAIDSETLTELAAALPQPATLDFAETPLRDVIAFMRNSLLGGINFVLDPRGLPKARQTVTLQVADMPLSQVLSLLMRLTGTRMQLVQGIVILSAAPPDDEVGQARIAAGIFEPAPSWVGNAEVDALVKALDKPVTLDFADTPLADVIPFLRDYAGVNMILDHGAVKSPGPRVTLKADALPLRDALATMLDGAGLAYEIRTDALFITNAEGLGKANFGWPRERPNATRARQYAQMLHKLHKPGTLDFADTPLPDVVAFMRDFCQTNIVLDPLLGECREQLVSLRVENVPAATALGAIAYLSDMRLVLHNGALLFTSEQAAEARRNRGRVRTGAGVVVHPDGYVLTSLATVEQAERVRVKLAGGKWLEAKVVKTAPEAATALLKIEAKGLAAVGLMR